MTKGLTVKKLAALLLILILLAAVPFSASAGSEYDSLVIGTWTGYGRLNAEGEMVTSGNMTLSLSEDGACSWFFAGESFSGTWQYVSETESGHAFRMEVDVWGYPTALVFLYVTLHDIYGDVAVIVDDTVYLYRK